MLRRFDHVLLCAQHEGGRAALAMRGYADAATAYYFAREATHYAREVIRMSRYDRRDPPGTDPEYCDGLAPDPNDTSVDPNAIEPLDGPDFDCSWCGHAGTDETYWPYCCKPCADRAALDSID